MDPVLETPIEVIDTSTSIEIVEKPTIREVILETPIEKVIKVLGFTVSVISVQLGIQARIAVHINCSCGEEKYNEYRELTLEGDEYAAWGSDDKYILEIVQSKLSTWF